MRHINECFQLDSVNPKLRFLLLDCAYDSIQSPFTKRIFSDLVDFKITSYLKEHQYGALPVDSSDFVASHLLLVEESELGFKIVMGFKIITQQRCEIFNLEFPALHVVSGAGLQNHREAIQSILTKSKNAGEQSIYIGSWTFHPEVRKNRKMTKLCYDVSVAMLVNYCREFRVKNGFTFAALRMKVERFHAFMGLTPLQINGSTLPEFDYKDFFNEKLSASFLEVDKFSDEACKIADFYFKNWQSKILISSPTEKLIAAA